MSSVISEISNGVLTLTLNRPEKLNSFNREMSLEFQAALKRANERSEVRAIVITGAEKAFCAGQDLSEAVDKNNGLSISRIIEEHYNPIVKLIIAIEKPVIAAVNGVAAGAGANLALACDIIYAAESATFIQAFSKIGLVPDTGGTFFLSRIVGHKKALALMMLGDKLTALEAKEICIVEDVFPDEQFFVSVNKIAEKLAKMPTKSLALTKKLLLASINNDLNAQLDLELEFQVIAANSYDYNEGVSAFLEKRKPEFIGR